MPNMKMAFYNNTPLSFTIIRIKEKTVIIGDKFENNPTYTITAKKGNTLWKIDLQPIEGKSTPETNCKSIIIKSRLNNKICKFYLQKEMQLATLPRY